MDIFGISYLEPTKTNGRTYVNNWYNGETRTFYSISASQETDPEVCFRGNAGTYVIGGSSPLSGDPTSSIGTMCMYGKAPRVYIRSSDGIANNTSGYSEDLNLTPWDSCEVTLYSLYTRNDCFQSYSGMTVGWGTNHIPDHAPNSRFGDYSSRTLYGQLQCVSGACYMKKELFFPSTLSEVSSVEKFPFSGPCPLNQWIGLKFLIREYSNVLKMNLKVYMDLTNGLNGGTWNKVADFTDYQGWSSSFSPISWYNELATKMTVDYTSYEHSTTPVYSNASISDGYLLVDSNGYSRWLIDDPQINGMFNVKYAPIETPPISNIILFGLENDGDNENKMYVYIDTSNRICLKVYDNSGNEILDEILYNASFSIGAYYTIEFNYTLSEQYLYVNQLLKSQTSFDLTSRSGSCDYVFTQSFGAQYKIGRLALYNNIKHTDDSYSSKDDVYDVPQQSMESDKITGLPIMGGFWHGAPMVAQYLGKTPIGTSQYSPVRTNTGVFIRNDYTDPEIYGAQFFKWFSVREIEPLLELPSVRRQDNVNYMIDLRG
jgi:hypothetical protein